MAQEHKARLDKMQADLEDMALKAKEKERDTARQLENVKTQAVFSVRIHPFRVNVRKSS